MPTKGSFYTQTGPTYQGDNPASSSNDGEVGVSISSPAANDIIDIPILFACTLNSVTVAGDVVGSAVFDLLLAPFGTVPTASITGSTEPTLASAQFYQDTALTGWSHIIPANSLLRVKLNSTSGLARVALALKITKG